MAGPLRVLSAGPVAATTEVEDVDGGTPGVLPVGPAAATTDDEDVDGGAPVGCCRDFWQRPPPELEMSMAAPLGVLR
jgi:hypothetical protein